MQHDDQPPPREMPQEHRPSLILILREEASVGQVLAGFGLGLVLGFAVCVTGWWLLHG